MDQELRQLRTREVVLTSWVRSLYEGQLLKLQHYGEADCREGTGWLSQ